MYINYSPDVPVSEVSADDEYQWLTRTAITRPCNTFQTDDCTSIAHEAEKTNKPSACGALLPVTRRSAQPARTAAINPFIHRIIMAALRNRAYHYIFALWFLSFYLFFFPRLISSAADWMSAILRHMMWPWCEFRMQAWNVLQADRWKYRMQKIANWAPSHNFVGLYLRN